MSAAFSLLRLSLPLLLAAALVGCASRSTSRYVPAQATARSALESTLDAWQHGQRPGVISTSPPVHAVDSAWSKGFRLVRYEILEEEKSEGPRVFSVRLHIGGYSQPQEVRYYIVGQDPVVVYRDTDYELPAGM